MKLDIQGLNDFSGITIMWTITNNCNYKCPYCLVPKGIKNIDKKRIHYINQFKDKIRYLIIFGGEPTLHPDIKYILENSRCNTKLWTNFSQPIEMYKDLPLSDITLNVTFHSDMTDIDTFTKKLEQIKPYCKKLACYMPISLSFKKESFDKVFPLVDKCETIPIVGIKNYYPDTDFLYKNTLKYDLAVEVKNKKLDNWYNLEGLYTRIVKCDRNKHYLDWTINDTFDVCNFSFPTFESAIKKDLICRNTYCKICFLEVGNKSGIFEDKEI